MGWLIIPSDFKITQGTVLDNIPWDYAPDLLGIVLSNPCDLQYDKASYFLLAALIPARETIQESKDFIQRVEGVKDFKLKKKTFDKLPGFMEQFIHNKNIIRYFFIDPSKALSTPPFFVDFQNLITIPISHQKNLKVIAQLPSPHREKMIMHFASYISRIGVERLDKIRTKELVSELVNPYEPIN